MKIVSNDPAVPTDETNLCYMVALLLKKQYHIDENVTINIDKKIPIQGGLSGGSTNAATTFQLLNKLWRLNIPPKKMISLSKSIGMDIPFYFIGNTAYDTETTGILKKINTNLKFNFVLIVPNFGISTKEAYTQINYQKINKNTAMTTNMKKSFLKNDKIGVISNIHNDFEISVFKKYPKLLTIIKYLKSINIPAVLSGSGSTIVGIMPNNKSAIKINKSKIYNIIYTKSK